MENAHRAGSSFIWITTLVSRRRRSPAGAQETRCRVNKGYGLRLTMGHARHGIHSWARDDSLLVSLQRGEPDVYTSTPTMRAERGVEDGDLVRVYNDFGDFVAMAHVSSHGMQPKALFMYHGWDPMMFRGQAELQFGFVH